MAHEVVAQQVDAARVGPHQSGELSYEGRLAGAVGAEQSEDLTAPDVQADAVGGAHFGGGGRAAPAPGRGIDLDQVTHRAHSAVRRLRLCCARTHEVRGYGVRGPALRPGPHRSDINAAKRGRVERLRYRCALGPQRPSGAG